jgi:Tol biopolymer transport system component
MMRWIAVAALLAVLIVPLWWYFSRQRAKVIRGPMRIVPFTALSGVSSNPRFSPDGKFVAFDWEGPNGDNWDIYVKQVGRGEEPFRLTRDPAMDVNPVWSPDGGEIAFVRVSGDVASIYAVPSLGGVERKLYESRSALFGGFFWWLPDFHGGPFSWSPDGHWLAFSEKSAVESPARIYLFSLDTRQKIALTSPLPGTWGDFFPEFSPESKRVAFVRQTSFAAWDLWVQPVASGEATRLTSQNYISMDQPAWTPDGNQLVFAASFSIQQSGLFRVPFSGGLPQTVAGIGANARAPAIWRNYMVFSQRSGWRPSLCRMRGPNYRGKDRSPAPLLRSRYHYAGPDYSPDGTRLTFYSDRSGFLEIWICNNDGTKPVRLTNLRKFSSDPRWSPDGRRVVFSCTRVDHDELYVIDAEGGTPRPLTNDQSQGEVPSWSRDGGWVYFASNRSGTYQVWKIPSEGGKAVQITKGGGFYAVESFDGKMLYYLKLLPPTLACGAIWKVPPEGGEETLVIDRGIGLFDWALRPEGIYFATLIDKKYSIDFLSVETGKITPFYQEETLNGRSFFAISPDGEWFAYTEVRRGESELMLVENFE